MEELEEGTHIPVFSLISHRTLKRAGFMRWQFRACFLGERERKVERLWNSQGGKTTTDDTPRRVREGSVGIGRWWVNLWQEKARLGAE